MTLSLQAIESHLNEESNENNGFPVRGLTTPIRLNIEAKKHKDKVCLSLDSFSFSLPTTAFLISMDVLPQEFSPVQAQWIDFMVNPGLIGHLFRDGSIRFSGPGQLPLPPGDYFVSKHRIEFTTKKFPRKAKGFWNPKTGPLINVNNFPISHGLSNLTGKVNFGFDYGEYYGVVFHSGKIYTATTDNSFDHNHTPTVVFNQVDKNGELIAPQIDVISPEFTDQGILGEQTLSMNPANPANLALTSVAFPSTATLGNFTAISHDGGDSWQEVDPFATIDSLPKIAIGFDPQISFDDFGNLFYAIIVNPYVYLAMSDDEGSTWKLIDVFSPLNPNAVGFDYTLLTSGQGANQSSATWILVKQVPTELDIYGQMSTLPLMAAAYQTCEIEGVVNKRYMELPGTEDGGFGTISVGPTGEVLVTGIPFDNRLGSLPFTNSTIWYSFNQHGFDGTFSPIRFVANSNGGYFTRFYTPQEKRGTFVHPNGLIDRTGRWYLTYVDQPSPHIMQANPNIYLIYSDDQGTHWSSPLRINNDVTLSSFHFMPQLAVDDQTNDLVVTWLDSREDELDESTRLWATVIRHGSLPRRKR